MDKVFRLRGIEFEWDEAKYALNLQKHGVRFEESAEVFLTLSAYTIFRLSKTKGERRYQAIVFRLKYCWSFSWNDIQRRELSQHARPLRAKEMNMQKVTSDDPNGETSISIPPETLEMLAVVAQRKDLPLKALLKLYIGQGLRQDMSDEEATALALKRMRSRKGAKHPETDLAA